MVLVSLVPVGRIVHEENQQLVTLAAPRRPLTSALIRIRQILNAAAVVPAKELSLAPPPARLGGKTHVPQSVSQFPQSRVRPAYMESPSQGILPITPEDLAKIGADAQLIPFIVSMILRAEQSPSGSPPLSTAEAEKLIDILDKVWSTTCTPPHVLNSTMIRSCHPPRRIQT